MTEEEAETKWCPMARSDGNNRHWGSENHIGACIASECMAWRWMTKPSAVEGTGIKPAGYCGLAGKP